MQYGDRAAGQASPTRALNVFTIETTINNRMFDKPLGFMGKCEDDLSPGERAGLKALDLHPRTETPQEAREAIFQRVPSPYEITGVFAGETEAVHPHTLKKCFEQYVDPGDRPGRYLDKRHTVHLTVQRERFLESTARSK